IEHLALARKPLPQRPCRTLRRGLGVARVGTVVLAGTSGREQRLEHAEQFLSVARYGLQGGAVLLRHALAPSRELRLGEDLRKRRTKLVGDLGRQPLLTPQAACESRQQAVEHGGERAQL